MAVGTATTREPSTRTTATRAPVSDWPYWSLSRTPWCGLLFLTPLLLAYEVGVLWSGGDAGRNGADVWLRLGLLQLGNDLPWLLPVLVVSLLLGWQIAGRFPWRCHLETLVGMSAESVLFAFVLIILGQTQDLLLQQTLAGIRLQTAATASTLETWSQIIAYLGAGIYEEVLFRLIGLPVCVGLLRGLLVPRHWAQAGAILITSLLFTLAHYVGPGADQWHWFSVSFRMLAGCFFAGLFLTRGFGITVGCHAAYDVLVGILLRN